MHSLPLPWKLKKTNLLGASYLFYAAWNPPFVLLLWLSTLVDWFLARGIHASKSATHRRVLLILSLAVNLGLLAFFKYGGFVLENFTALVQSMGFGFEPLALDVVLPVGISFYTFQTLSYTLDIYRNRAEPWHSFLDYALYVTFMPQLVAGPIVRSGTFLPQCLTPRRATSHQLGWGAFLLLLGLFQKVVVADGLLAPVVEQVYDTRFINFSMAWHGTLAFAGQIFCDFAGYSTCAIGIALCLGFSLPDNFRFPYAAMGFSDFWQRWHISLSSWLRDYLYIPLGGSRISLSRTQINLMMTMFIGGLWHGASWTFVVWGGLHGSYLVAEKVIRNRMPSWSGWQQPLGQLCLIAFTFIFVCFAWVFFRASDFSRAFEIAGAMLGLVGTDDDWVRHEALMMANVTLVGIAFAHITMRATSIEDVIAKVPWWMRSAAISLMLIAIVAMPGEDRAFIYFQF